MTNDDREERVPVDGSTPQGELVAAHWARLSLTVDGAMLALRSRGIAIEQATADDLHRLDMLHMGGLAATDALAEMTLLKPLVAGLGDRATLHVVEGGDHGLRVLVSSGRTNEDAQGEALDAIAEWMRARA